MKYEAVYVALLTSGRSGDASELHVIGCRFRLCQALLCGLDCRFSLAMLSC